MSQFTMPMVCCKPDNPGSTTIILAVHDTPQPQPSADNISLIVSGDNDDAEVNNG